MRPPSYYTSLANSNSSTATSNRNSYSQQQFRSSFSSSSSSSYVTRTHLPFVSQSMLVAHCFTGVGSSTKPYGQSTSRSIPSSSYSSTSHYSSRPLSTKRHHTNPYLASQSTGSYSSSHSTYLSPYSTTSYRPSTSYRTPSSSSYYKPIRLRERPQLTQISRQFNSTLSPTTSKLSTSIHSDPKREIGSKSVSDVGLEEESEKKKEENWSSDVARNISRNKYLIKFKEIDKRSLTPIESVKDETKLEQEEATLEAVEQIQSEQVVDLVKTKKEEDNEMRLPASKIEVEKPVEKVKAKPAEPSNQIQVDSDKIKQLLVDDEKKKVPREKRNIKLKIKTVNSNSSPSTELSNEQTASEQGEIISKDSLGKSPKIQSNGGSPIKPKVKKLIKTSKSKTSDPANEVGEEVKESTKKKSSPKITLSSKTKKSVDRKVLAVKQVAELDGPKVEDVPVVNEIQDVKPLQTAAVEKNQVGESSPGTDATNKRIRFREYHLEDFNFLSVLGHGGWGFVILAELKQHDACFAVKCIKKITIVEDDDFDSIMIERKVLTLGNIHPFICKLFCTFETDGYLFFVMEYCAGGDMMFHVQKEGKFTESRCRFYAAEIICAIRFLHNRHIIYRDLKLDNILLDSNGHIRLVDFGMCQCRTYREEMLPSNFCGTPEYISPEIIKGVPYNHSVDWWSFGVLLYEMAVGKMPFRGNDENELLWNVCYEQIHYPMFLTKELTSLLQSLLEREPTKRMGMATCKSGDIYDQPWFRGVDWAAYEEMRVPPPFVPEVNCKRDVQNFDTDFTQSTPELSPVDESTLKRIDQNQFQKFPYTNPNIFIFD